MSDGDGQMTLYDAVRPQLRAARYTLTAEQTLGPEVAPPRNSNPYTATQVFHVQGPRFTLQPDDIYSVYPPNAQKGAYANTLPHVVFKRKTLPWERRPDPGTDSPWMALLVLNETEVRDHKVTIGQVELAKLTQTDPGIQKPGITLQEWEKFHRTSEGGQTPNVCSTIEMPLSLFRQVAPRLDELQYLAHARAVKTHNKEDIDGIGDGWFSVLLGNRVPTQDKPNFVFLVSLEGFSDLIRDQAPQGLSKEEKIRLVLLWKWSFDSEGRSFEALIEALTPDAAPTPDANQNAKDAWLRVRPPGPVANEKVRTALDLGYVPMRHLFRQGKSAISWYRGPLVPMTMSADPGTVIYRSADEALQLDPDLGMFDVSYAAAWQLGRLLGLQAPEFGRALLHGKSGYVADELVSKAQGMPMELGQAAELLQNELMAAIAMEWCGG